MKTLTRILTLLFAVLMVAGPVVAQQYPNRPVRMVIGFPPGGGTDIMGRIISGKLSEGLGQQIVVDNRGGASGQIAAELVAKASPDGYTVMLAHIAAMSILPSVKSKLPYDPVKEFSPITLVAISPNLIVVHPSLPVKDMKSLIALAKARPGQLHYASPGAATVQHLAAELFKLLTKVDMVHIPYKGAGPAVIDLIAGHVHLSFDVVPVVINYVKAGRLRPIAVTAEKRISSLPQVPTVAEGGLSGFNMSTWWGLVAPSAVSKDVITRLHSEAVKVLRQKEIAGRIADQGAEAVGNSQAEFGAFIQSERNKYARIAKEARIRID